MQATDLRATSKREREESDAEESASPDSAPPDPIESKKDRKNRLARELREKKKIARTRDPVLVARPWEHVPFYKNRIDTAGQDGGVKILGKAPERSDANDGRVYKDKSLGKVVVYVHAHGISYTISQIEDGALAYELFQKIIMKDMGAKDRLLILDPVTGKALAKPDGPLHPLHIFLADQHEYGLTDTFRVNKRKEFVFVLGDGTRLRYMPDVCKERDVAMAEAVAHAKNLPNGRECNKCGEKDLSKFGFEFKDNQYILLHGCYVCKNKSSNARNAAAVKTIDGKAIRLAESAIQNQNERKNKHPHLPIPKLDITKVKPPFASLLSSLMISFLALPCCVYLGIQSYNVSLDKIIDALKYYIGTRSGSSGEAGSSSGDAGVDLSNISLTPNINNGRSNATEAEKTALIDSFDRGEGAAPPIDDEPIDDVCIKMLDDLESQIGMGGQASYSCDYHSAAAEEIKIIVNHMKYNQNERRKKKGREHMLELTEAHLPTLRRFVIYLLKKQKFRCKYSSIRLCPAGKYGFKMSVERIDDNIGYEVRTNLCIVFHLFQAKLNSTQRTDEDGNEEFANLTWSRDVFFKWGRDIFGDEMRFRFTDLPIEERRKHEAAIAAAMV